jgi:hypothetical protein
MSDSTPAFLDADHLDETLTRLDELLSRTENVDRLRSGLGMRLALTMAKELRDGKALGTETAPLVAGWTEKHGQESVDMAVAIAREFLTRPDSLVKDFAQRLQASPPTPSQVDNDSSENNATETNAT